ncbi:inositol polyphosphate kinase-domain-containing protein [Xylariales sp. PMI_506]|nr:inositol polyphosphate kinase-domain-containing protein [Xylariales sp. PMI_506]
MEEPQKLLAPAATFPPATKRSRSRDRMPEHSELVDYNYAVAGHAGTMCDADGELFIKPCTQAEIDFYESARVYHPEFADLMPLYFGSLELNGDSTSEILQPALPSLLEKADIPESAKKAVQSHLQTAEEQSGQPRAEVPELQRAATDGVTWIPNKSRRIKTSKAVVLENATYGYKKPNIMDAKLGVRLWADDAPLQKRTRFDQIASETTHKNHGFRVAGMRVYKGSEDASDLDEEEFKVYDKNWGRDVVNDENVLENLRGFIFNEAANIDAELGKRVAQRFVKDLQRVQRVLEAEESRMYSSSLLFVFEGDGATLRTALDELDELERERGRSSVLDKATTASGPCANHRVDSGIGLDDEERSKDARQTSSVDDTEEEDLDEDIGFESWDESEDSSEPYVYGLKLIDFAHAEWVPGQGPDQNILLGVRSLMKLFQELAQ